MELLEIIPNKPEAKQESPSCPFCKSERIKIGVSYATAVGGRWEKNGDENDPNHYTRACDCFGCDQEFYWEFKRAKQWYSTFTGHVIQGVHGCFEHCTYPCNKCVGKVERKYTDMDGVSEVTGLASSVINGVWTKHYRTFWNCDTCKQGVEV